MANYRVKFFKIAPGSTGHKHLQQQFDVVSESPSGALVLAEAQVKDAADLLDCIEVERLSDHPAR
ncbi:hypothetical protein [Bradyrhizobium sp. dw_78]|uniref:hypothetical protein n=1 Tax=Bradyrhizobium sp. dw_78 TaxID=2719793 RepID=UPI001BD384FA|nr:hypothetical protein [Bradyrhizobium sp. dw_78]